LVVEFSFNSLKATKYQNAITVAIAKTTLSRVENSAAIRNQMLAC